MDGYAFPNESEFQWSILIVLYPYITGLVAGAFILASLVRVFDVKELQPAYRLPAAHVRPRAPTPAVPRRGACAPPP